MNPLCVGAGNCIDGVDRFWLQRLIIVSAPTGLTIGLTTTASIGDLRLYLMGAARLVSADGKPPGGISVNCVDLRRAPVETLRDAAGVVVGSVGEQHTNVLLVVPTDGVSDPKPEGHLLDQLGQGYVARFNFAHVEQDQREYVLVAIGSVAFLFHQRTKLRHLMD